MPTENESEGKNLSTIIIDAMRTRGFNMEKLAQLTGISDRFLSLLIDERFDKLPSSPYVHGYVTKIAEVLGLDGEKLWKEFLKDNDVVKRSGGEDKLPGNRFVGKIINKKWLIISLIGVIVLGYVAYRIQSYFGEPYLSLDNLGENVVVNDKTFSVIGKMNTKDQLEINGEHIFPDENGSFEKKVELQPGFNTLNFKIKKYLGNEYTIEKQIFFQTSTDENTETGIQQEEFLQ